MLTREAKTVLYQLYKEYCSRRKKGISRSDAKQFGSAETVQKSFFSNCSVEDILDAMNELKHNGYLKNFYADDTIYLSSLTDDAIFCMENQTKETLLSVVDFVTKFIP